MSIVSPVVLRYDLAGGAWTIAPNEASAKRVLTGYFYLQGGRLSVHATLRDPLSQKTLKVLVRQGPPPAEILPLLDQLAKDLSGSARSFSPRDETALQTFGEALNTSDPAARIRLLQATVARSPAFSEASLALAQLLLEQGDRAGAAQAAQTGANAASDPDEKAELEYDAATAFDDLPGREKALGALIKLRPANTTLPRSLAEIHTLERKFDAAIQDYQKLALIEPNDATIYNTLGYLYAYSGDLAGADRNLRKYQDMAGPGDFNPLDSLGEVHYMLGDFANAERYFMEAQKKNPAMNGGRELLKAAQSRLMTGDLAGADQIMRQFVQANRAAPGAIAYIEIEWLFLTGRRTQAMSRLETMIATGPADFASIAAAQLAVWKLQTGDLRAAMNLAAQAQAKANSPAAKNVSALVHLAVSGGTDTAASPLLKGIALVLQARFGEAIEPLSAAFSHTMPASDGEARTLLAWCFLKTNRESAAAPLLTVYPFAIPAESSIFDSLAFPRFLRLHALSLKSQPQKFEEARHIEDLYYKYEGDVSDSI